MSSLADVCSGGEEETDVADADDRHHDSAVDSCNDESATADVVETEHGDEDVVDGSDGGNASTVGVSERKTGLHVKAHATSPVTQSG